MAHHADPDGPPEHHPREDAPYDLGLRYVQAAGELRAISQRKQNAERQGGEARHQREPIELIEPLERREELEDLTEAPSLELAELQEIERRRDERERHQCEPEAGGRNREGEPTVARGRLSGWHLLD